MKRLLIFLAVFALAIPLFASDVKKGDFAIGYGAAQYAPTGDFTSHRDDLYSANIEFWPTLDGSVIGDAIWNNGVNIYSASYAPKLGSFYVPIGLCYVDLNDTAKYGGRLGLGINFWAEKFLGLQFEVDAMRLNDNIADQNSFVSATAKLRVKF